MVTFGATCDIIPSVGVCCTPKVCGGLATPTFAETSYYLPFELVLIQEMEAAELIASKKMG